MKCIRLKAIFVIGTSMSAVAALAQTPSSGSAGYFSCRDASGRLLTSDRPIIECLNREQRQHNADGSVRAVMEAPLTPEQRKARDDEAKRKADAEALLADQRRRDRILLSSYSSTASLDAARARALVDSQTSLERSKARLAELQRERKGLEADQEFYKKGGVPASVSRKIEDNAFGIRYETDAIKARQDEITKINQRFDAEKARLEQLLAGNATSTK